MERLRESMSELADKVEMVVPIDEIKAGNILNDKYVIDSVIKNDSLKAATFHGYYNGRQYAVKIYKFKSEIDKVLAAKLCSVDSPHVASVVDVFDYDGNVAVVTPYYSKGSIEGNKYSLSETRDLILPQICKGLEDLHKTNLFHGSLKPSNIMINDDGKCFSVTDYGQYLFNNSQDTSLRYYKKEYASPELYEGKICSQSDYYALGMCIYAILCGNLDVEHCYGEMTDEQIKQYICNPANKVPLPDTIPSEWRNLVYALTYLNIENNERNHDKRWGHKEIVKWLNGETLLYPTEKIESFAIDDITCLSIDDLREYIQEKGRNRQFLGKICSKLVDSDFKLNPAFEKWLISMGKQPELDKWRSLFA